MANQANYNGTKAEDGTIEGNYLPVPRTMVKVTKAPEGSYPENASEFAIANLFQFDGATYASVDNAIYNAALKKKYGMTTVTNNYIKHLATMVAPKCQNKTDAELEDWGIVIDADAVDADRATYEGS
jgi:hypothetical protein